MDATNALTRNHKSFAKIVCGLYLTEKILQTRVNPPATAQSIEFFFPSDGCRDIAQHGALLHTHPGWTPGWTHKREHVHVLQRWAAGTRGKRVATVEVDCCCWTNCFVERPPYAQHRASAEVDSVEIDTRSVGRILRHVPQPLTTKYDVVSSDRQSERNIHTILPDENRTSK